MSASTAAQLLREDLRGFGGYRSARSEDVQGTIWLNANESPMPATCDTGDVWRRYPQPQPQALREAMAALHGVRAGQVLMGRGSDEGIDLLLRAFCRPGQGAIVVAPPVFGMYAVCARLQGARVVDVPLHDDGAGFRLRLDAMGEAAIAAGASLLFLCSPGNPAGDPIESDAVAALAAGLRGRAIVVVDEAYGEFATQPSAATLLDAHDNIAVLRTLSKAHALAGLRVGCLLAQEDIIGAARRCQAPYPLPQPCVDAALAALAPEALARTSERVRQLRLERARLGARMAALPGVRRIYPSEGNFLLVRFADADAALAGLLAAGVVVRDMRTHAQLGDALRISVGTPAENDAVVAALSSAATEVA
ncbi:MAG: histidinol-phosphate transaminase [Pseudomonadota bacterium]|nr:histidinol-phosphate transaminase [Pseudomonadota bacterium]